MKFSKSWILMLIHLALFMLIHINMSYLKYAEDVGVYLMTFDCQEELMKIKQHFPKAQLVLRIKCDDPGAMFTFGKKFGEDVSASRSLLLEAKSLGMSIVGVAFHVGCECRNIDTFHKAIASAKQVFSHAEEIGFHPYLLDLGGGYPGNNCEDLDVFASVINSSLEEFFPHRDGLKIIAEPGRYIAGSALALATKVIATKKVLDQDVSFQFYINDGIFGTFGLNRSAPQNYQPQVLLPKKIDYNQTYMSCIWGPALMEQDFVQESILLPRLQLGDWMFWPNVGAYSLSLRTSFNGFPKAEVYYITPSKSWCDRIFADDVTWSPKRRSNSVSENLRADQESLLKLHSRQA